MVPQTINVPDDIFNGEGRIRLKICELSRRVDQGRRPKEELYPLLCNHGAAVLTSWTLRSEQRLKRRGPKEESRLPVRLLEGTLPDCRNESARTCHPALPCRPKLRMLSYRADQSKTRDDFLYEPGRSVFKFSFKNQVARCWIIRNARETMNNCVLHIF